MINLRDYDIIIINSSAGKDSLISLFEIHKMADKQNFPRKMIFVSHQDLGRMEWPGTKELAIKQAGLFGFNFEVSKRRDKNGKEETLLEYVRRRGKWPSNKQRYCTSDFKRGPGARVVTRLTKDMPDCRVLYIFGFRKEESPARAKKVPFQINRRMQTKKRMVIEYLPVHEVKLPEVWETINNNKLPYHPVYDLGIPRLSCSFCIFSPFDVLVKAGMQRPELLEEYYNAEQFIGHTFKNGESIADVKKAIDEGYVPKRLKDWKM